jgi:AcrR family transcriptional regulator
MNIRGSETREKITGATLRLINEEGDIQNLSVRRIAKLAGVSFSTINYHFQSKDSLIDESLNISVKKVMNRWIELNKALDMDPAKKLKLLMQNLGEYYSKHPNTMRISLLRNFSSYEQTDSSLYYFIDFILTPLLLEICPEKSKLDIEKTIEMVFLSFPHTFLHFMFHPERSSINFFVKEEREAYFDKFVDILLYALKS